MSSAPPDDPARAALRGIWGHMAFRPLQAEAVAAVLEGSDSLVILPTGGGKSLCFQLPAVLMEGTALVVSPLIALMKDQVDALRRRGIAAGCLHSGLDAEERRATDRELRSGALKLLYLSPERLMIEGFLETLAERRLSFIAIDEAHCISMWGHDFRREYRMLGQLRERLPHLPIHAYTATASERVEQDIVGELGLRAPRRLVGSFERENLTYRVLPKGFATIQIAGHLDRRRGQSAIVYCISRKETEEVAQHLRAEGHAALAYHAGMNAEQRARHQDDFQAGRAQVIVATVAFGMGIDKPDVRMVIHAGLPKSVEHYQQESGRAGRDGLPSECLLLHSPRDAVIWRKLMDTPDTPPEQLAVMRAQLRAMEAYTGAGVCRTDFLLRHFGQSLDEPDCGHCDTCLGLAEDWRGEEMRPTGDSLVTAQKILSCVVRMGEKYGETLTVNVLVGSREKRIAENGLDKLSTYGLLRETPRRAVRDWIQQLKAQECLAAIGPSPYRVLKVTDRGWAVLRGKLTPALAEAVTLAPSPPPRKRGSRPRPSPAIRRQAVEMALSGTPLGEVAEACDRARPTIEDYIVEHFADNGLTDPAPLVDAATVARIEAAHATGYDGRLRTLREAVGMDVSYLAIRVVLACLANRGED